MYINLWGSSRGGGAFEKCEFFVQISLNIDGFRQTNSQGF